MLFIASILGLSLGLKICYAMFSATGSNSLYLEMFRFVTLFEKKLFRTSAVSDSVFKNSVFKNSVFKISPFSLILNLLCVIFPKVKVSLISRMVC